MPLGKYPDFASCVADQMKNGNSKESANKICGTIEKQTKGVAENKRILTDILFSDNNKGYEILKVGEYYDPRYGKFKVTEKLLNELEDNFKNNILNIQIAVDKSHTPEDGAFAWIEEIYQKGKTLYMSLKDITEEGKKILEQGIFKYFSVEFSPFETVKEGKKIKYENVLKGVALTNRPVIKSLNPTFFSETLYSNQKTMKNFKMVAENIMKRDSITDSDIDMLKKLAEEVEEEDKKEVEEAVTDVEEKKEEVDKKEKKEEAGGEDEKEEEKKELAEKKMKEDNDTMRFQLSEQKKMIDKMDYNLRRKEMSEEVDTFILSEKDGVSHGFIPKEKEKVIDFLMSIGKKSDEAIKLFSEMKTVDFRELGSAEGGDGTSNDTKAFAEKIKTYEKEGMEYTDAMLKVSEEMPKLAEKMVGNEQ